MAHCTDTYTGFLLLLEKLHEGIHTGHYVTYSYSTRGRVEGERWTHCKDPVPSLEDGLVLIGGVVLSHQVGTLILEGVGNCVCV